jgi:hypothetical protein
MTQDAIRALSDEELTQVISWAQAEVKTRAERRKLDTIAKIKELARSIELGIKIEGTRGRPAKRSADPAARRAINH